MLKQEGDVYKRQVLGKEDFSKLKKGDILICNCTSPEWTPLFSIASAAVSYTHLFIR